MKIWPHLLTILSILTCLPTLRADEAEEEKPAAEEAATEEELTKEQAILKEALANMSRLRGYHVEVELKTPAGKATLSGDLGEGTLSLVGTDVKGVKKRRVVVAGKFYLSTDDGKTWVEGADADKETTLLFNNIITAPVQMAAAILEEGTFTSKEEKLKGEDVLHLTKPAEGESAALHFWLCKETDLDDKIFVRKAELMISATDIELPAVITYTKLAKPVKITAPEVK